MLSILERAQKQKFMLVSYGRIYEVVEQEDWNIRSLEVPRECHDRKIPGEVDALGWTALSGAGSGASRTSQCCFIRDLSHALSAAK